MQHLSDFQTRLAMCVPVFAVSGSSAPVAERAPLRAEATGHAPDGRGLSHPHAPWISRSLLVVCCGLAWGWLLLIGSTTALPMSGAPSSAPLPGAATMHAAPSGRAFGPLVRLGGFTAELHSTPQDSCIPYSPSGCITPRVPTPAAQLGTAAARVVWGIIVVVGLLWGVAGFYQASGLSNRQGLGERLHLLLERLLVAGLVDVVTWHLPDVAGLVEATLNAHLHDPTVSATSLVGLPVGVFGALFSLLATALVEWFLGWLLLRLVWECLVGLAALHSLGGRALGATLRTLLFLGALGVGIFAAPAAVNLALGLFLS